jgi:hypothetical protein
MQILAAQQAKEAVRRGWNRLPWGADQIQDDHAATVDSLSSILRSSVVGSVAFERVKRTPTVPADEV